MSYAGFPSKAVVESVRKRYPEGSRVELISMNDPYSKLKTGDKGTVLHVDDIGTVHVKWDNGLNLGLCIEDYYRKCK